MSLEMVRLFLLNSSNIVMFWDMMVAARTAGLLLHSEGLCSRSPQKN